MTHDDRRENMKSVEQSTETVNRFYVVSRVSRAPIAMFGMIGSDVYTYCLLDYA
jgi:hypothetical protein